MKYARMKISFILKISVSLSFSPALDISHNLFFVNILFTLFIEAAVAPAKVHYLS